MRTILNPAPAPAEPIAPDVDYLTPNETRGAGGRRRRATLVLTLGEQGAGSAATPCPAFPAKVVDTTGAGDAFCAAFAVALAEGADELEAVRWGCAAGAHMVEHEGVCPRPADAGPPERSAPLGAPEPERFQAPDDERAGVARLLRHVERRPLAPQLVHRRLELDAGERSADADVDASPEADVLRGVLAPGSNRQGARTPAGRGWPSRRAARPRAEGDRLTGDLEFVGEHPAFEELERRIEADHLLQRGRGGTSPETTRAHCSGRRAKRASRCPACSRSPRVPH